MRNIPSAGTLETMAPIDWDTHAKQVLELGGDHYEFIKRQKIAELYGAAAVFFISEDIDRQLMPAATQAIQSGQTDHAVFIPIMKGARPFFSDLERTIYDRQERRLRTEWMRTSTFVGTDRVPTYVVVNDPDLPLPDIESITPDDTVIFVDDGLDNGETLEVIADFVHERHGVTDFEVFVALTKQPGFVIPRISRISSLFTTPHGVYGSMYGFNGGLEGIEIGGKRESSDEVGRFVRAIGMAMIQPKESVDSGLVTATLETLGGKDGFARATIDDIVKYNQVYNSSWAN